MPRNPSTYLKLAGLWLILMATGHGYGHFTRIADGADLSLGRRAVKSAMESQRVNDPFDASMWTAYEAFSLGIVFFLVFAGITTLIIAGVRDASVKTSYATFSLLFWLAATAIWMWMTPMWPPLAIAAGTLPLFGYAAWRSR